MENKIKIFENKQVRTAWNADKEEWYFSVVDVVAVLTDSVDPNNYWKVLKNRLKKEGSAEGERPSLAASSSWVSPVFWR